MPRTEGRITALEEVIERHYNPRDFVGRRWLVREVARFRDSGAGGHLIIVGEPGSGKSAFVAYLAAGWNCPRHFIRVDSMAGVTGLDPRGFLISLGAQLYQKYGRDIFPQEALGTTEVHAGWTGDQAQVVGRLIDRLYTLPFLPLASHGVRVWSAVATGQAQVVGERIREVHSVADSLPETTLLRVAILDPLKRLHKLDPDQRVVILVDALDEAVQLPGINIVDLIPKVADAGFPSNLCLVMTSRPGTHLGGFRAADQLRLDDETRGFVAKGRGDARRYIKRRLAQPPLADAVAAFPADKVRAFVDEVQARSEGDQQGGTSNFLYLYHFFNEAAAAVQAGRELRTVAVPRGLDEIYQFFAVVRIKGETGLRDWVELYLPLLGVLAVIREAVGREQLAGFAGVRVEYVDHLVAKLEQFLDILKDENANRYRLYHGSFGEYLLDSTRNRDFPLDGTTYHYRIARYYRGAHAQWAEVDWGGLKDEDAQSLVADERDYPLRHLATHLHLSRHNDELHELVAHGATENHWARVHYERTGSHADYTRDLDLAWRSAETACLTGRTVLYALILASIRSAVGQLPPDLLVALVRYGVWPFERALAAARESHDAWSRAWALVKLARSRERSPANEVLEGALDAIEAHPNLEVRGRLLALIFPHLPENLLPRGKAASFALPAEPEGGDRITWEEDEDVSSPRSEGLAALAIRLATLGRKDEALVLLPELHGKYPAKVIAALAPALSEADLDRIRVMSGTMDSDIGSAVLMAAVAQRFGVEQGAKWLDRAMATTLKADPYADRLGRAEALSAMAPYLDSARLDRAMEVALATLKADAVIALAKRMAEDGRALEALQKCRQYSDYGFWWRVLPTVAPHLDDGERERRFREALEHFAGSQIVDRAFSGFVRSLPDPLLDHALALMATLRFQNPYPVKRAWIERLGRAGRAEEALQWAYAELAELPNTDYRFRGEYVNLLIGTLPYLASPAARRSVLDDALAACSCIDDVIEHASVLVRLEALAPAHLPQSLLQSPLERARDWHARRVLQMLTPLLSDRDLLEMAARLARRLPAMQREFVLHPGARGSSPRVAALARLAGRYPEPQRAATVGEILTILQEINAAAPHEIKLYRARAREELKKHLPGLTVPELEEPTTRTDRFSEPALPVRVIDRRPSPAQAFAAAKCAIEGITQAGDEKEASRRLVNAYIRVKAIRDEKLQAEALRMLASFWRLAARSERNILAKELFWSIATLVPDEALDDVMRLALPVRTAMSEHLGFVKLLMHIAKRRADLFQRLWPELLRRAAEAGRAELLSKLPGLLEARGVSDPRDLAVETAGAIDTAVRWWP